MVEPGVSSGSRVHTMSQIRRPSEPGNIEDEEWGSLSLGRNMANGRAEALMPPDWLDGYVAQATEEGGM